MDKINDPSKKVNIIIEKRGDREDKSLSEHLQRVISRATYYVSPERISSIIRGFRFKNKLEDITGLQIADLAAYPIVR